MHLKCMWTYVCSLGMLCISRRSISSAAQSCPTLCDPMDCSMPGFPVHHQLAQLAQTPVHRVGDAIQPSHPLLSPPPPSFNLSKHQGLFQGLNSSHQVAKYWSFSFSNRRSEKHKIEIAPEYRTPYAKNCNPFSPESFALG